MSRMDALMADRRKARQERASTSVAGILSNAERNGIFITLIGSLAKGDFGNHSDVDLLVRGSMDTKRRRLVEKLVADGMRSTDIPYDLIFEDDLSEDRRRDFLHGVV